MPFLHIGEQSSSLMMHIQKNRSICRTLVTASTPAVDLTEDAHPDKCIYISSVKLPINPLEVSYGSASLGISKLLRNRDTCCQKMDRALLLLRGGLLTGSRNLPQHSPDLLNFLEATAVDESVYRGQTMQPLGEGPKLCGMHPMQMEGRHDGVTPLPIIGQQ